MSTDQISGNQRFVPWLRYLITVFVLLHGALMVYDLKTPEAFTHGDRASDRIYTYKLVFEKIILQRNNVTPIPTNAPLIDRLHTAGHPGDYLIASAMLHLGGPMLVILAQVLLTIGSIVAVFYLAQDMGLSQRGAFLSALSFGLFPGTIIQAHMLVTEPWFIPSTCFTILAAARILRDGPSASRLSALIIFGAFAVFFRIQFAPLLVVIMLLMLWFHRKNRALFWAPLILIALLPIPAWQALVKDGQHLDPEWDARSGISIHLRLRLARMSRHDLPELARYYEEGSSPTPRVFLETLAQHPVAYLKTVVKDNMDYFLNPGTIYFSRYLHLIDNLPTGYEFRALRDKGTPYDIARYLWNWNAVFCLAFLIHAGVWFAITCLVVYGLFTWMLNAPAVLGVKALVFVALLSHMAIIQIAYQSRWSLRQPIEFYFAIFFVFGLTYLYRKHQERTALPTESVDSINA